MGSIKKGTQEITQPIPYKGKHIVQIKRLRDGKVLTFSTGVGQDWWYSTDAGAYFGRRSSIVGSAEMIGFRNIVYNAYTEADDWLKTQMFMGNIHKVYQSSYGTVDAGRIISVDTLKKFKHVDVHWNKEPYPAGSKNLITRLSWETDHVQMKSWVEGHPTGWAQAVYEYTKDISARKWDIYHLASPGHQYVRLHVVGGWVVPEVTYSYSGAYWASGILKIVGVPKVPLTYSKDNVYILRNGSKFTNDNGVSLPNDVRGIEVVDDAREGNQKTGEFHGISGMKYMHKRAMAADNPRITEWLLRSLEFKPGFNSIKLYFGCKIGNNKNMDNLVYHTRTFKKVGSTVTCVENGKTISNGWQEFFTYNPSLWIQHWVKLEADGSISINAGGDSKGTYGSTLIEEIEFLNT